MAETFSGIECPACGSIDLKVLETRKQPKAIVRYRQCDRRHKFFTVEVVKPVNVERCAGCPILPDRPCRLVCMPLGVKGLGDA